MSTYKRKINLDYTGEVIFESINRFLLKNSIEIINQNSITLSYTIKYNNPDLLFNVDINELDDTTSISINIIESNNNAVIENEIINDFLNYVSKYFQIVEDELNNLNRFDYMITDVARYVVKYQICNEKEIKEKFKISYTRTGMIIDQLEILEIVGGSKKVICESFDKLNNILIQNNIIKESEKIYDIIEEKKKGGLFSFLKK